MVLLSVLLFAKLSTILIIEFYFLSYKNTYDDERLRSLVCCQCWSDFVPENCSTTNCCVPGVPGCPNDVAFDCCGCYNNESQHCCSPISLLPDSHGGICDIDEWPLVQSGPFLGKKYNEVFKSACPNSISWSFDNSSNTYQCQHADYQIVFCFDEVLSATTTSSTSTNGTIKTSTQTSMDNSSSTNTQSPGDAETTTSDQSRLSISIALLVILLGYFLF